MEFWLIEEGKRTGPFQEYDVRERIQRGEVSGEIKGWHRDQKDWLPLREIPVFITSFEELTTEGDSMPESDPAPPPLPANSTGWGEIWMRFLARWTDFVLFQIVLLGGFLVLGRSPFAALQSPWFLVSYLTALVIFEAIMLSLWGTTPGKWIAGIRIENAEGGRLSVLAALGRSARVMIMGMGLWLPFILVIGHLFAVWFLRKKGVAPWDALGFTVFRLPEIRAGRVVAIICTLLAVYFFNSVLAFVAMWKWPDDLPEMYQKPFQELKAEWTRQTGSDPPEESSDGSGE